MLSRLIAHRGPCCNRLSTPRQCAKLPLHRTVPAAQLLPVSLTRLWLPVGCVQRSLHTMVTCFQGSTVQELKQWLEEAGVDTSQYGQGLSKSVEDLLDEVCKKESVLQYEEGQALRTLNVVSLHLRNSKGQVLFEEEQVLPDGRSRRRQVAVSEKMIGSEPWRQAAQRAIQEELGSVLPPDYELNMEEGSYFCRTELATSMSYPGLPTKYIFHRVKGRIQGLPEGPFSTSESRPGGVLITHWIWRDITDNEF